MWTPGCQPRDTDVIGPEGPWQTGVYKLPNALVEGFTWQQM